MTLFSVSMIRVPPSGIASRAFRARLSSEASKSPGSISTSHVPSDRSRISLIAGVRDFAISASMPRTNRLTSTRFVSLTSVREKSSSLRVRSLARWTLLRIMSQYRVVSSPQVVRFDSISAFIEMMPSTLFRSCASPPVN